MGAAWYYTSIYNVANKSYLSYYSKKIKTAQNHKIYRYYTIAEHIRKLFVSNSMDNSINYSSIVIKTNNLELISLS